MVKVIRLINRNGASNTALASMRVRSYIIKLQNKVRSKISDDYDEVKI